MLVGLLLACLVGEALGGEAYGEAMPPDTLVGTGYRSRGPKRVVRVEANGTLRLLVVMHPKTRYRMVVAGSPAGAPYRYLLRDGDRRVIFDSRRYGNPWRWDFEVAAPLELELEVLNLGDGALDITYLLAYEVGRGAR